MFSPVVILLIVATAFVFWVGVFVLTSNPFNASSRIGGLLLIALSVYFIIGALIFSTTSVGDYKWIFRLTAFSYYVSVPLWFHYSVLSLRGEKQSRWLPFIVIGYLTGIAFSVLEATTNLVTNYNVVSSSILRFKFIFGKGPLFLPSFIILIAYALATVYNLIQVYLKNPEHAKNRLKHIFPIIPAVLFLAGVFLVLYTFVVQPSILIKEISEATICLSVILLAVNVFINRLLLEGAKTNLNREFFYSTISVLLIIAAYLGLIIGFKVRATSNNVLFVIILLFIILSSHSIYDWLMSFVRNIFYQGEIVLPRVTDEEVSLALRNLNKPEKLEKSSLMRLKIISVGNPAPGLDKLRNLIRESIEYFKPDEPGGRARTSLKYQILKYIGGQVEEGQILWDLGFEEYPMEIAEKAQGSKPQFRIRRPTDYQAISRNAFISLKKEAIHNLAWRISYLERHLK
jgi:hypothetical protein